MQQVRKLTFVLLAMLSVSCRHGSSGSVNSIVGTWSSATPWPVVMAFSQAGTYELRSQGVPMFSGSYRIDGDRLMLHSLAPVPSSEDNVYTIRWLSDSAVDLRPVPAESAKVPDKWLDALTMHLIKAGAGEHLSPQEAAQVDNMKPASTPESESADCVTNVKQLSLGMLMYSQDYDEVLPSDRWEDSLMPYVKAKAIFDCPAKVAAGQTGGYAMNSDIQGAKMATFQKPEIEPGIFDADTSDNVFAATTSMPDPPRHADGNTVGYLDGHVERIK